MEKKIKVLNLYAGIGGNRKLWKNVDVTAVEIDENIANTQGKSNTHHRTLIKSDNFSVANCLNIIKMLSII